MGLAEAHERTNRSPQLDSEQDVVFDILKNRRRRQVIRHLRDVEGAVTIGDLSEQLAAWENDVPVPEVTYKQRKRVYISLHQTHLPKLDDSGVVDYDRRSGAVALNDSIEPYEMHLDLQVDDEKAEAAGTSPLVYGIVSGLGVVAAFTVGMLVFSLRPDGLVPLELLLALFGVGVGVGASLVVDRS